MEVAQTDFQLLRRLEMNNRKSQILCLVNIGSRIVDKEAFPRRSSDLLEQYLIDLRIWLDKTYFAGEDNVIEQVEEIISLVRTRKGLCRPVAQTVKPIARSFELAQDSDCTRDGSSNRIDPVIVVRLDEMRIVRKLLGKDGNPFSEGTTLILLQIPIQEINFFEKALHRFGVIGEEALIEIARVPGQQDVTKIENDRLGRGVHAHDCSMIDWSAKLALAFTAYRFLVLLRCLSIVEERLFAFVFRNQCIAFQ